MICTYKCHVHHSFLFGMKNSIFVLFKSHHSFFLSFLEKFLFQIINKVLLIYIYIFNTLKSILMSTCKKDYTTVK